MTDATAEPATAAAERPMYFAGSDEPLLGIVTSSPDAVGNVVIFSGGWHGGSINANRMLVRLARRLAAGARNVVRFDWLGAGESPGHIRFFRLDQPGVHDGLAAVEVARQHARVPTSLVGICIGTRAVLAAAPHIPSLDAVALVSFPLPAARAKTKRADRIRTLDAVRQGLRPSVLKGWLQPATRRVYLKFIKLKWQGIAKKLRPAGASTHDAETVRRAKAQEEDLDTLVQELERLFDRGVRVLLLFGTEDAAYEHFTAARQGQLGSILERNAEHVDVLTVEGDLSGFSSLDAQQSLIDSVAGWLERSARPTSRSPGIAKQLPRKPKGSRLEPRSTVASPPNPGGIGLGHC